MSEDLGPEIHSQIPAAIPPLPPSQDKIQQGSDSSGGVDQRLRLEALREASNWEIVPRSERVRVLQEKWREAAESIGSGFSEVRINLSRAHPLHEQVTWFRENTRPLRAAIRETRRPQKATRNLLRIKPKEDQRTAAVPRPYRAAQCFLGATGFVFDRNSLSVYVAALQEHDRMRRALTSATNPITWPYRRPGIANRCGASGAPRRS